MTELPASFRTPQWNGPLAPLNLTAYATWIAVASGPALDWKHGTLVWDWPTRIGVAGMFAVLILYVLRCLDAGEPMAIAERHARRLILLQAGAALLACWGLITCCGMMNSRGPLPVLLTLVAGQLAVCFSPRATAWLLFAINLPLVVLLLQRWSLADAIVGILAFCVFQLFTALIMTYAKRTEHARDDVLRINAELLAARQLLSEGARAEERLRLSRELHDIAGHKLTALKMQLALQARQAQTGALSDSARLADELLADIRGVVDTLRQHEGVDLQQALRALDPRLPLPVVHFELDPALRVADMRRAETLLRCAQEGLTNALRHADARMIRVGLTRTTEGVELSVADDGRGRAAKLLRGNGLNGLSERLAEIGGRLELRDRAGGGLVLRALLPDALAPRITASPGPERTNETAHHCPLRRRVRPA